MMIIFAHCLDSSSCITYASLLFSVKQKHVFFECVLACCSFAISTAFCMLYLRWGFMVELWNCIGSSPYTSQSFLFMGLQIWKADFRAFSIINFSSGFSKYYGASKSLMLAIFSALGPRISSNGFAACFFVPKFLDNDLESFFF